MKVLFYNGPPYFLTHGGMQTTTEALMRELTALGVEVEPERWWDDKQKGDIVHHFQRPSKIFLSAAHAKGFRVVLTECLGQTAARGKARLLAQRCVGDFARVLWPEMFANRVGWEVYQELDAMVYFVEHEWEAAKFLFRANPERGYVIPGGSEPEALAQLALPQAQEDYLVCMGTIYQVKNTLLLARAAKLAGTPIVFLGKPYGENDPYFQQFKQCVDGTVVRYPGFAAGEQKNRWLRGARGFVMLSQYESAPISINEASAAGLPMLLSDLPWATKVYGGTQLVKFVRPTSPQSVAPALKKFYNNAHRQKSPTLPLLTWRQVAERYLEIYRKLLASA